MFPITMRKSPSLVVTSSANFGLQGMSGIPVDTTAFAFQSASQVSPVGALVQATVASGATLNTPYALVSVTGTNTVNFLAEL
jgi:hypothetical protein